MTLPPRDWANVLRVHDSGVPIVGFTRYPLPAQSVCLIVPVVSPGEYDDACARRVEAEERDRLRTGPQG